MNGLRHGTLVALLLLTSGAHAQSGRYLEREEFLQIAFAAAPAVEKVLWINRELREPLERILGHSLAALRVRYWQSGTTTAWILDEIGMEKPITIGVKITDAAIDTVKILAFRESRGWEVRYPFFTDQFIGAGLDRKLRLDRSVDGITGATLSVRAVDRVARVALYLHRHATRPPPA